MKAISFGMLGIFLASPAYAYIDPGSGTFLLQILAAAALGGLFYLRRIRDYFLGFFRRETINEEAAERDE